jgi:hypothetical protein
VSVVHHHAPAPEEPGSEASLEQMPPGDSVKFGPVTVVLVSLLAGVAAFFLSRLIPF